MYPSASTARPVATTSTLVPSDYELRQIVENLVGNAIRYTHSDGRIDVTLRSEPGDDGRTWAVFEVCDNGIGIPRGTSTASSSASTGSTRHDRARPEARASA